MSAAPSLPLRARLTAFAGLLIGAGTLSGLLVWQGVPEVGGALAAAGWGLLVVALYHVFPLLLDASGWWRLLPAAERPQLRRVLLDRWIGESVNTLLPVMQIGGPVVRARLLMRDGVAGPLAGASVVVDVTLLVISQIVFTILGILLLVLILGGAGLVGPALAGVGVMGAAIGLFILLQRRGLFGKITHPLAKFAGSSALASAADGAASLDQKILGLYKDHAALRSSFLFHLCGWIVGTGEVWLALYFLDHPVPLVTAMLLEALGQAVRAGAFVVPGALGVQEGAFLLLGRTLGIPPETALALSLSKRCRELLFGVPGLVVWQLSEANSFLGQFRRNFTRSDEE
ncbi:MAG: lysylphosphatidylglycerol synthase domain-containing protein [Candidatus Binatia bacterium]|nr:lysylphosphatidylglycerol synthase domain-containing protein [Candidatus Binatia bacterium]MDG1960319.1 lysylphosphatidylglycerol synthase domain-containing protein [Candidatus Binatia bacterium]MDG2008405.1 lysylphosphatidylglycerol synthase domain-containing protein [Candidatus Binatia bacterium]